MEIDNGSDIPEKANEEHPNDGKVGEKVSPLTFSV